MTFFQLGDFCGAKDSWWFKKVRDGTKSNKGPDASCKTPLQMLYYFDEDYCIVDLTKDLKTDQKNKEYVSIFHNFVIILNAYSHYISMKYYSFYRCIEKVMGQKSDDKEEIEPWFVYIVHGFKNRKG